MSYSFASLGSNQFLFHSSNPCAQPDANPDDWFPDRKPSEAYTRKLCNGCTMLMKCREYAKTNMLGGIWGGKYFPHVRGRVQD